MAGPSQAAVGTSDRWQAAGPLITTASLGAGGWAHCILSCCSSKVVVAAPSQATAGRRQKGIAGHRSDFTRRKGEHSGYCARVSPLVFKTTSGGWECPGEVYEPHPSVFGSTIVNSVVFFNEASDIC